MVGFMVYVVKVQRTPPGETGSLPPMQQKFGFDLGT